MPPRPDPFSAPRNALRDTLLAAVLVVAAQARAAPLADACPPQLPVRQALARDIPGWTAQDQQAGVPFVRVQLSAGAPADGALIVPSTEYRNKSGMHDTWELPRKPAGYWITCRYGDTTASITRRLDDDVDFCLADYDARFLTLVVRHWACGDRRLLAVRGARRAGTPARPAAPPQPPPQPPPQQ